MASRFDDNELTDAEQRLELLRRDLEEIQKAIREAEQLVADSKPEATGLMLKD